MMKTAVVVARTYGERTSATLNALITRIGSAYAKVILDGGSWLITSNVTVPVNIALEIFPDAVVDISAGIIMTINSASFLVHRTDWYSGSGSIAGADYDGKLIGRADRAAYAEKILSGGIGAGLQMSSEILEAVEADSTTLGSVRLATETEAKSMTDAEKVLTPAVLENFLHINYASYEKLDAEAITFVQNDSSERIEPAVRFGVTITPRYSDSKILILAVVSASPASGYHVMRLFLNRKIGSAASAEIKNANTAGNRTSCYGLCPDISTAFPSFCPVVALDSPGSTEAVQYYITFGSDSAGVGYINRTLTDADNENYSRTISTMFAVELTQKT